jgi:Family of unknown function (DUF5771)
MSKSKRKSKSKGPIIIPPFKDEGFLRGHGYSTKEPARSRREALEAAIEAKDYSKVIKKLNAVAILNKNTNPTMSNKVKSDMKYLHSKYRGPIGGRRKSKKSKG